LNHLYSFVNVDGDGDFKNTIGNLEDVIIRIAVQTIECGIFVQEYTSNTGEWLDISSALSVFDRQRPAAPQTILETQQVVSRLSKALGLLEAELEPTGTPPTTFVSAQTSQDAQKQGTTTLSAM
jgi:hypothetical protein